MLLTNHFTLAELTASAKARELGIDNTPPQELVPRLILLAEMLEKIRASLGGAPVIVTSGYRCLRLNQAVGGVTSSDHTQGHAADFVAPAFGPPWRVAKALARNVNLLGIGQLILERLGGKNWVHVSTRTPEKPENRIITVVGNATFVGIQEPNA
jgi:zinc D-Ala-D-Ala carboxypeptidase